MDNSIYQRLVIQIAVLERNGETMTDLEQFQASKVWSDDLGAMLADCVWQGEPPAKGWVYLDALYIEAVQEHWPAEAREAGQWHLIIGREESIGWRWRAWRHDTCLDDF